MFFKKDFGIFERLFGWSKAKKCKSLLKMLVSRINLLKVRRKSMIKLLKQDAYLLICQGSNQRAFGPVESLYKEINQGEVHEMLEKFCECLLEKIPYIRLHKDLPDDIKEAASSLIYAAARCGALPELQHLRKLFAKRYGQEFVSASVDSVSCSSVNEKLIEKLSTKLPDSSAKLVLMKQITQEFNVPWDSIIEDHTCKPSEKKSTKQDTLELKPPQLESTFRGDAMLPTKQDDLEVNAPQTELTVHGDAMITKDKPLENQSESFNGATSTVEEVFDRDISGVTDSVKEVKRIAYNVEQGTSKLINSSSDNFPGTKCRDTAAISCIDKGRTSMEDNYGDSAISCKTTVTDDNEKNSTTSEDNMLPLNMKPLYDNYSFKDSSRVAKTSFAGSKGEIVDNVGSSELKISKRDEIFQRHMSASHKARPEPGINSRKSRSVQKETSEDSSPGDYGEIYLNTSLETQESDYSPTVKSREIGDQGRRRKSVSNNYSTVESENGYSGNWGRNKITSPYKKDIIKEHYKRQSGKQNNVETKRHSIQKAPLDSVSISKDTLRRNYYEIQPRSIYSDSTVDNSPSFRHIYSKREGELYNDEGYKEATVEEESRRLTTEKAFIHHKHREEKGRGRAPEFVDTESQEASSRCSSSSPSRSPITDQFSRQLSQNNPTANSQSSPSKYHRTNTDTKVFTNRQQKRRANLFSKLHKQTNDPYSIHEDYSYLPNFEKLSKNSQRTRSYKQSDDVHCTDESPSKNSLPKDCKGRKSHIIVSRIDGRSNEEREYNHKIPSTKLEIFETDSDIKTQYSESASKTGIDIEMVEENKGMTKQIKTDSNSRSSNGADYAADEEPDSPREIEVSECLITSSPAHPSISPHQEHQHYHQQIHTEPASPVRSSVASPTKSSSSSADQWQRVVSLPVQQSEASLVRRSPRAPSFDDRNGRVSS